VRRLVATTLPLVLLLAGLIILTAGPGPVLVLPLAAIVMGIRVLVVITHRIARLEQLPPAR